MRIVVDGKPIAQARPRFYRRGNHVGTYSAQESEAGRWVVLANSQIDGKITEVAVDVDMTFVLARPKGHYGTGRNAGKLKPSAPKYPKSRPDIDNYCKWVLDCLNSTGNVWKDDSQVVSMTAVKRYGGRPRTEIEITEAL